MADKQALILAVTRAQAGDPYAFDYLVQQFQNPAVAYARFLLRDPVAAEDAAQEAFLQAWRDLPRLTEASAFGGWLRRIVFKFCDRLRRSAHPTVPLPETLPLPLDQEPAEIVARTDEAARVRAAIDALPDPLREATLLYYLSGYDVKEIAAFLEAPPSTVKNRLHAARKHLRKELWAMAETVLNEEKPSQDETFTGNVLTRILAEFQQQEARDPHSTDRNLLEQGRVALCEILAKEGPLDTQTIRDGFILLWRKQDWIALSTLLMRYLGQPLSDSETAWAYIHLANVIGSAAGGVLAHEAFERWMPGKSPSLSVNWPYYPAPEADSASAYIGEEVRLLFLGQSVEFASSYVGVWRFNDYVQKVDTALAEIPVTPQNRNRRFYVFRIACAACEGAGYLEKAQYYIEQMHVLAAGAEDETLQADLKCRALGHDINLARLKKDEAAFMKSVTEMTALLNAAEQKGEGQSRWIRAGRHEFASQLVRNGRHDLALPLLEANAATGGQLGGGWGWLIHAASVWKLTQERERTLTLLREARVHDDRDLLPLFTQRPEFASVLDDPEFLQAVERNQLNMAHSR